MTDPEKEAQAEAEEVENEKKRNNESQFRDRRELASARLSKLVGSSALAHDQEAELAGVLAEFLLPTRGACFRYRAFRISDGTSA